MTKTQVAIWVTPEELEKIELIQRRHMRTNKADTLRMLINLEAEKILSKNISNEIDIAQQNHLQP